MTIKTAHQFVTSAEEVYRVAHDGTRAYALPRLMRLLHAVWADGYETRKRNELAFDGGAPHLTRSNPYPLPAQDDPKPAAEPEPGNTGQLPEVPWCADCGFAGPCKLHGGTEP